MKNAWRNLRTGLSKSQVKGILGSPARIDSLGILETWHYGSGYGGGSVTFDDRGKVSGWSEPQNIPALNNPGGNSFMRSGSSAGSSAWRSLRTGLSKSQVKGILGSPARIDSLGILETWHYGSGYGGGSVTFDDRGKVNGWSEPR